MPNNTNVSKTKVYRFPIIVASVLGLAFFLPAGSLMYWEAWIYWLGTFAIAMFTTYYFLKKDPMLMDRRSQVGEKEPQKLIVRIISFLSVFSFLIPGFDYRFHWSAVPVWLVIASNIVVFLGFVLIFFVFKENSYASSIIEVDKKQRVITTGPYAIVRHPMYSAILIIALFTPLALGSYWALPGFLLFVPVNIFRIIDEEKLLIRELPGYRDYCSKTHYRLIPLIW
ncbi:methyltransferase family protein [Phosphitispora sp. TUW77]|uniref:methyltransferase family protein n=1 Tax=Phosphitispora sp. TUW77 TaxID=3152361 RepID=UPI003AB289E6